MREEVELYLKRAEKFRKNAEFNFDNGDYDLAMFHHRAGNAVAGKSENARFKGIF